MSTTPSPWSTPRTARSIRSTLVPSPPSSVPPAATIGTRSPAIPRASATASSASPALWDTSTTPTITETSAASAGAVDDPGHHKTAAPRGRRRAPHQDATDASAAMMSAEEAAPGSWCPMLRSPR